MQQEQNFRKCLIISYRVNALQLNFLEILYDVLLSPPSEIVFQEQSYSSLNSGQNLAWDHFRGNTDDPCGVIANFCGIMADPCSIITNP